MRQFVSERFAVSLSRSTCLEYLHRVGFAFKRPKRGLLKADAEKREAFVAEYAALAFQAQESGERIFFADEAHFRADAELRGKRVLRGKPALVDSTSPRYGERASYYSAVCLESGEVEWMELEGNSNSGTSAAFLEQLRGRHRWSAERDLGQRASAPFDKLRSGEAVREWLGKPGVNLGLVSPRFHEGRLCRDTARTSTPPRPSGAGRGRRRPETCASGRKPRWRRKSATSSLGRTAGKRR